MASQEPLFLNYTRSLSGLLRFCFDHRNIPNTSNMLTHQGAFHSSQIFIFLQPVTLGLFAFGCCHIARPLPLLLLLLLLGWFHLFFQSWPVSRRHCTCQPQTLAAAKWEKAYFVNKRSIVVIFYPQSQMTRTRPDTCKHFPSPVEIGN